MLPEILWWANLPLIARKTSLARKYFGMFAEDHITARRGVEGTEFLGGSGWKYEFLIRRGRDCPGSRPFDSTPSERFE